MSETINDLYLKYVNEVGASLEDDRYFQYLYEMVNAGANTLQQNRQVLHKVVDERWLTTIEESLDSINAIIDKPRRFIARKEEVVPVALAKKITADSVRHLSMHTELIASDEDGEIQPTKILNVSSEESYDLYENRFIYHLIQRLVTFIDKRTDVIFWSTGDEIRNTFHMESKVDDAYEQIEYKIDMKIKNLQSFEENDSDNLQVFMRIDRVRRLVMALRNSPFCSIMAGCAKVRSPIQRTNLMMKDPDYRTCYKLWQFLESYDEVGYTIEERNSVLEFDEEYMIQMYTNLITNYTVFKSILEGDDRKLEEVASEKKEPVKPKFIKEIKEEIVDDYNIPDVEVRQVIIEEVTQAQLDAEAKLAEETELRKKTEEERDALSRQLDNERWQMETQLMEIQQEADAVKRQAKEEAEEAKKTAEVQIAEAREKASAQVAESEKKAAEKIAEAEAEAKRRAAEAEKNAAAKAAKAEQEANNRAANAELEARSRAEQAEQEADNRAANAEQEAASRISAAEAKAAEEIAAAEQSAEERVRAAEEEAEARTAAAEQSAKEQTQAAWQEAKDRIEKAEEIASNKIAEAEQRAAGKIALAEQEASDQVMAAEKERDEAKKTAEDEIEKIRREAKETIARMQKEAEDKVKEALEAKKAAENTAAEAKRQAEKEEKARRRAEAKADEARLTNRIAGWIDQREALHAQIRLEEAKKAAAEAERKAAEAAESAAKAARENHGSEPEQKTEKEKEEE